MASKAKKVLAARRTCDDYIWLTVDGERVFRISDSQITWVVGDDGDEVVAHIQREYYQEEKGGRKYLEIESVKIVGSQLQIEMLLDKIQHTEG